MTTVTPTLATEIHDSNHAAVTSVPLASIVHDQVTLSSSNGTPEGTVDFAFFSTGDCSGSSATCERGLEL